MAVGDFIGEDAFSVNKNRFGGLPPILARLLGTPQQGVGTPPFFPGNPQAPSAGVPTPPGGPAAGVPGAPAAGGPAAGVPAPPSANPQANPQAPQGFFDKADAFLQKPGGNFLMNLLAQSGYSTTPQSPLRAIGRAGLMTAQQGQQRAQSKLNDDLIRAEIGLKQAQAAGAVGSKAQTDLGKLRADFDAGRITQEAYDAQYNEIINKAVQERFKNTQALRGEFTSETKDIAKSMQSLSAAQSLVAAGQNPIAQLAAFISTIKSIDNSTVREGELRAFESVQGFVRQLENMVTRAKGEGFSETLRVNIADTISRLERPLTELLDKKRGFYNTEAGKFNLDPESITGSPFSSLQGGADIAAPTEPAGLPPAAVSDGVTPEEWAVMPEQDRRLYR